MNRAQVAFLVGQDLAVGHPGVVIDNGVDVVEPDPGPFGGAGGPHLAAMGSPAATVGDPPDPFHVDVDQLAGPGPLVADGGGFGGSNDRPGQRIQLFEAGYAVAVEHSGDGSGRDPGHTSEAVRAPSGCFPGGQYRLFDRWRGSGGLVMGG